MDKKEPTSPLEILAEASAAGELNHLPPEFLKALEDGQVEVPHLESTPEQTLVTDGDATLMICDNHFPRGFMFTLVDGGGFTGILVCEEDWEAMKVKVDNFIKQKKEAQNAQTHAGPGAGSPEGAGREN